MTTDENFSEPARGKSPNRRPPAVLIPGIQGRWEWMQPAFEALREDGPVFTFSLGDRPIDDPAENPFDAWVDLVDRALDNAGLERALILGHSFGGLAAIRYAARRPDRTAGLVLISTPSPRQALTQTDRLLVRLPRLTFPLFVLRGAPRMVPEILAARETWRDRLTLFVPHFWRVIQTPASPAHMAAWVRAWGATDIEADCPRVSAPTLVVTGERRLDRVVPVEQTVAYLGLIPQARHVVVPGAGHLLPVVRSRELARLVSEFARDNLRP